MLGFMLMLNLMTSSCIKYHTYALPIIMFYHKVSLKTGIILSFSQKLACNMQHDVRIIGLNLGPLI